MIESEREIIYGKRPVRRTNRKPGQSEWYYLDPRGAKTFSDMKQIDVENENTPNPYASEIRNYLYNNDEYTYKALYGDEAPQSLNSNNSYTTESAWGYPNNSSSPFYKQDVSKKYLIGSLSQEFESNGENSSIGFDDSGGYSYGLYQIATRPGTMKEYLQYLSSSSNPSYVNYAEILNNAGGFTGALNKTAEFEHAWKQLSQYPEFSSSQSEFIGKNRYNKIINRIQDIQGLNLNSRHPVVSDVIRSMAVQHGRAQIPIHDALGINSDVSSWSDKDIINALYDARSNYMANIKYTSPEDIRKQQNIINNRYPKERKKALDALNTKYIW